MEVDTGTSVSVISESGYYSPWLEDQRPPLQPSRAHVTTYTKELIPVVGKLPVAVAFEGQQKQLSLLVVPGDGPTLLGRNWLQELKLNWAEVLNCVHTSSQGLNTILESHSEVFGDDLGN